MLKPHCDNCGVLIEVNIPTWIQLEGNKNIFHFDLSFNNLRTETLLCHECTIKAYEAFLVTLKDLSKEKPS